MLTLEEEMGLGLVGLGLIRLEEGVEGVEECFAESAATCSMRVGVGCGCQCGSRSRNTNESNSSTAVF